jgi:hypothetical protein
VRLVELGELHLRDLDRPEPTYILAGPGLPQPQPTPDRRAVSSAEALGECGGDGSDEQASPEPGGLTTPVTSLVDRQVELSKLSSLLPRHRLVTLIGAGGVGKTRLATHVAGGARENGLGDAWWAELTGVTGDDDTAVVILDALGVRGASDMDASERMARNLVVRRGVLVLDNCEHVRAPVGAICDMVLKRAPSVRILATSR